MKIVFVCKYNSGRSQMAEGFFNALSKKHHAISAGTHATERADRPIPEFVIKCMDAVGVDISKHRRMQLTQKMVDSADKVVMITAKEDWPDYVKNSLNVISWDVEDAKDQSYEFHCNIRNQIKKMVQKLIKDLD